MRVVCQQPNYFPWLGYFEQVARADSFVYLDNVQWIRQGRQHRTRVPNFPQSVAEKNWLTVPVHGHGHRARPFREIEIDREQNWIKQHAETIRALYGRAPFFRSQLEPLLAPFWEKAAQHRFLIDLCEASVALFWKPLALTATVWHSSDLEVTGQKTARLVNLCQALEATEYYSALGASRYLEPAAFRAANVNLRWQHFRASPGADPRRPCDYSVLDWVALHEWGEIRARLGKTRGTVLQNILSERAVDGIVTEVSGTVH